MKRFNYTKTILSLFALAMILCGASVAANAQAQFRRATDFDGDGKADITTLRYNSGSAQWFTLNSTNNSFSGSAWGGTDFSKQMTGDYDGDGKADLVDARFSITAHNYTWYIRRSQTNTLYAVVFGAFVDGTVDTPIPADYDGDGKTDIAVVRRTSANPGTFIWYYLSSLTGQVGSSGIITIPANGTTQQCFATNGDFNGDGRADYAYRCVEADNPNSPMTWNVTLSSNGARSQTQWGLASDQTAMGDYDGDGKTDFGVARATPIPNSPTNDKNLVWYVRLSSNQTIAAKYFGGQFNNNTISDYVAPADYDGDGKTDFAVMRTPNPEAHQAVTYYILPSLTNQIRAVNFGFSDDYSLMLQDVNAASLNGSS